MMSNPTASRAGSGTPLRSRLRPPADPLTPVDLAGMVDG